MKIKKIKLINLLDNINKIKIKYNINIYKLINILSIRANIIKNDINLKIQKLLLLLKSKYYKKNIKNNNKLKFKLKKLNNYPNSIYLSILELLKKKLIIINK
ncbi:MAG: hypothetical protein NHG08_00130 [Candidatus Shikimatogenerans sp. JK-2022]|nr:hypothetical protein [Candidatus Shikimatogenerans bostrichidophilus]